MPRTKILPKPLSEAKGYQVLHSTVPKIGEVFFTYNRRKNNRDVVHLVVTDVAEYRRAADNSLSYVVAYKDNQGNYFSSGMKAKSLAKHGKTIPDIHRQRRSLKFSDPYELETAKPIGTHGIGVKHMHVPAIGELFWSYPDNDMSKQKIYVKVTEIRPYKSKADGSNQYRIYYKDKDNNLYASCLTSYKLVNLSEPDKWETKIAEHKRKKQNA